MQSIFRFDDDLHQRAEHIRADEDKRQNMSLLRRVPDKGRNAIQGNLGFHLLIAGLDDEKQNGYNRNKTEYATGYTEALGWRNL